MEMTSFIDPARAVDAMIESPHFKDPFDELLSITKGYFTRDHLVGTVDGYLRSSGLGYDPLTVKVFVDAYLTALDKWGMALPYKTL